MVITFSAVYQQDRGSNVEVPCGGKMRNLVLSNIRIQFSLDLFCKPQHIIGKQTRITNKKNSKHIQHILKRLK